MSAPALERRPEPGRGPAGALALMVHLAFFAFLVFGVSWRTLPPQGLTVDLWTGPTTNAPVPPAPPPPAPEPEVKAPPPEPKPEPKPVPKAEPKPEPRPAPPKPDIALKEKQEKAKQEQQAKREEAERKRQQEEQAKRDQRALAEARQRQAEQEALARQTQAAAASAQARAIDEFKGRILAKVKRSIVLPAELPGNPQAVFEVVLLPGGDVLSVRLVKSSGHPAYDAAVERAIVKAQPFPLPPDPALFEKFRTLDLRFRPVE